MSTKKSMQDLCVVKIGLTQLLLPATDGLKVMALVRNAVEVERGYDESYRNGHWVAGERPTCEMVIVSANEVRAHVDAPRPAPRKPQLLGHG